jgi:uncharacterized membrane protein
MSNSAKSIFVFGIYAVVLGATLLVAPNALLTLFGLPGTNEIWIRVVGMLLFLLAFYYIQAARTELSAFFRWTVYTRASIILFFIGFVVFGLAKPVLILFGGVDLLSAIWTALALRSSNH